MGLRTEGEAGKELGDALGDRRGEIFDMARELADARVVAVKQMQIEVDRLFREGELLVSKERYDSAIERFERVLETIRWFPYNVSRDELQKRAEVAISKARDLRGEQLRRFRRQRQQAAIEEAKAEKAQSLRYRNARLKALYRNALEAYKAERYTRCEELCEEILRARPSDLQTSRLRRAARVVRARAPEGNRAAERQSRGQASVRAGEREGRRV